MMEAYMDGLFWLLKWGLLGLLTVLAVCIWGMLIMGAFGALLWVRETWGKWLAARATGVAR